MHGLCHYYKQRKRDSVCACCQFFSPRISFAKDFTQLQCVYVSVCDGAGHVCVNDTEAPNSKLNCNASRDVTNMRRPTKRGKTKTRVFSLVAKSMFVFTPVLPWVHICVHVVWFFCHWGETCVLQGSPSAHKHTHAGGATVCSGHLRWKHRGGKRSWQEKWKGDRLRAVRGGVSAYCTGAAKIQFYVINWGNWIFQSDLHSLLETSSSEQTSLCFAAKCFFCAAPGLKKSLGGAFIP